MNSAARDRRAWVLLGAIVMLAVVLRAWNLGDESAWYDEVITAGGLDAPSLGAFFEHWRFTNWNAVPIYYVLEYYWAKVFGPSILSLRWLSILFGVAAIPVLYRLGRDAFGRTAGLTAALCLALSSVHIYQAQEVRNYALTTFAAVLCAWTFHRFLQRDTWPNLAWNALANLFLVWTHLFGCYLLVACGLALILFRLRSGFPRTAAWFVVNLVLMIPSLVWIRTFEPIQYYQPPPPELWMIANNMLTDVWSPTLVWGIPAAIDWQFAPGAFAAWLSETAPRADQWLLFTFLTCIVAAIFVAIRRRRQMQQGETNLRASVAFLLLWLVVPGLILLMLSWTWRTDVISPKYTTYSSLAAYLIAGAAIQAVPRRAWRILPVVFLAVLFLHRVALVQTHPQRPDWYAAADTVKAGLDEGAPVLIHPDWQVEALTYNLAPHTPFVVPIPDLATACKQAEDLLAEHTEVWLVWAGGFGNFDFPGRFCAYLDARGVPYTRDNFWGGMKCLVVVEVMRPEGYAPLDEPARKALFEQVASDFSVLNDGTNQAFEIEE